MDPHKYATVWCYNSLYRAKMLQACSGNHGDGLYIKKFIPTGGDLTKELMWK